MKKKWIGNLILLLISTVFALIVVELVFRFMLFSKSKSFESLRDPSAYAVYPKDDSEDFHNEDYWKLVYRFRNRNNIENPQPLLGWWGFFNRETLEHVDEEQMQARRPVLLYGDSFAKCVDSVRCFEDILNNDSTFSSDHYLLNYGVGGYGIDQICLLVEETVDRFENPFVIFSLLTADMDRSMLQFRDAQKPYFEIKGDKLELRGVPIDQSTDEFVKDNPPSIRSYLFNRFRNSILNPAKKQNQDKKEAYIEGIKELNEMIITRAHENLKKSGLDYVFLIFHPEHHAASEWRISFLRDLCDKHSIPSIFDLDIRENDSTYASYDPYHYAIRGDGHPTSYMNTLIARELKQIILGNDNLGIVKEINNRNLGSVVSRDIEYYKNQILSSPEWLEHMKEKAEIRGITLDSMIYLDAKYMMETKNSSR
ncbi:MAG: hypothetical protein AMS26_07430 [Bacteroides sp. SM23_62]|nr:MAG: hypothetical protein AMS26_07430 [Bacteroides sp. SM23_62]